MRQLPRDISAVDCCVSVVGARDEDNRNFFLSYAIIGA
jgi:hypothetical protein